MEFTDLNHDGSRFTDLSFVVSQHGVSAEWHEATAASNYRDRVCSGGADLEDGKWGHGAVYDVEIQKWLNENFSAMCRYLVDLKNGATT